MARLILEEGGERRAFRVNQGKLTIGSSEACTLTGARAMEDMAPAMFPVGIERGDEDFLGRAGTRTATEIDYAVGTPRDCHVPRGVQSDGPPPIW